MLPASWKPVPAGGLIRLGSPFDGGYVLSRAAIAASDMLLSMGLNDDWQFEKAFAEVGGARIICFDHSVDRNFWLTYAFKHAVRFGIFRAFRYFSYRSFFGKPGKEHRQLKIGYDGPGGISLATVLREVSGDAIFLKADIEGSEYRILDDIVANATRFIGIVMEFHDVDLHRPRLERFIAALPQFRIVYLHANNYGGVDPAGDPLVLEVTLIREDLIEPAGRTGEPRPEILPNDPNQPDIELTFEASDRVAIQGGGTAA